jgi:hypothetical protein
MPLSLDVNMLFLVNTLFLVTIYVEAILGLLLQNTALTAVAWWGFAHLFARRIGEHCSGCTVRYPI